MKKISFVLTFSLLAILHNSFAQSEQDYFHGKWELMVFGTTYGNTKMTVDLTRYTDELTGFIMTDDGGEPVEITKIIEEDSSFTLYFNKQGG
jgi:hypothetical protein